ncbi:MAG: hypothetical protein ACE5H0_11625 [Bacteroidota bacterium]
MPRVILTITYEIHLEKREDFLALVKEMKEHFTGALRKNYSVFELKGKKNVFTEMFLCESLEEYENLEENQDDRTQDLVTRLFDEFVKSGKAKYVTLIESM